MLLLCIAEKHRCFRIHRYSMKKMCDENDIVKIEFERKFNQFDPKCVFRKYG